MRKQMYAGSAPTGGFVTRGSTPGNRPTHRVVNRRTPLSRPTFVRQNRPPLGNRPTGKGA